MKSIRIIWLLAVLFITACTGKNNGKCIVEGSVEGLEDGYVTFTIKDSGLMRKDTVAVQNSKFHYEVEVPYPMRTVVNILGIKGLFVFPFEPGYSYDMHLDAANLKKSSVIGGMNSEIEAKLDSVRVALLGGKTPDDFRKQIAVNKANPRKLREELSVIEAKFDEYVYSVCMDYPKSYYATDHLCNRFNKMPFEKTVALYEAVSKVYPTGKPRHSRLDGVQAWISREKKSPERMRTAPFHRQGCAWQYGIKYFCHFRSLGYHD